MIGTPPNLIVPTEDIDLTQKPKLLARNVFIVLLKIARSLAPR